MCIKKIKNLLTYLIFLVVIAGCGSDSKDVTGYWSFSYGEKLDQKGVAEIDTSNFMWYYNGIGFVPSSYFIKDDSLYGYDIVEEDTVVSFKDFLKFNDLNHFELKNKDWLGKYERITEKELKEFIDERESRIEKGEEDIIPIIEKKY